MRRAALASLLLALAHSAHAAPWEPSSAAARAKLEEGRTAFQVKDYQRAGELFLASDDEAPNLNARWNAAQSFAAAGNWKRASALYDSLVADQDLPKERRTAVEARRVLAARFMAAAYAQDAAKWDEARSLLLQLVNDRALGDTDHATAATRLESLARAQADAARTEPPPLELTPPPEPALLPPPRMRPSRVSDRFSLVLIGVGVVGAGVGGGLLLSANRLDEDANTEPNDRRARELHDSADSRRTIGAVALGIGGAVLAAGVVKFIVPQTARPMASITSFRPLDGGGVLVLSGALP